MAGKKKVLVGYISLNWELGWQKLRLGEVEASLSNSIVRKRDGRISLRKVRITIEELQPDRKVRK